MIESTYRQFCAAHDVCRAQMQFVQMAARTLYTLEVDVSNVMTTREAAERMEEAVKQAQYPSGSLVKFVLTGETSLCPFEFQPYVHFSMQLSE